MLQAPRDPAKGWGADGAGIPCVPACSPVPGCPGWGHSTHWRLTPPPQPPLLPGTLGVGGLGVLEVGGQQGREQKAWEGCQLPEVCCFSQHFHCLISRSSKRPARQDPQSPVGPPNPAAPAPCPQALRAPPAPFSVDPEDKTRQKSETTQHGVPVTATWQGLGEQLPGWGHSEAPAPGRNVPSAQEVSPHCLSPAAPQAQGAGPRGQPAARRVASVGLGNFRATVRETGKCDK